MSTPGGGSGMQFGDDYVAARLAIDVPEGSSQAVREITQEVERFHTTLEATVRAEADAMRYLDQMAESSRKAAQATAELTQQWETFISVSSRGGGYVTPPMGVPHGGAVPPFGGQQHGMGGDRAASPTDVSSQMAQMAQTNPREYLNMQQQRGNLSSADMISINPESIQELANKLSERERVLQQQQQRTDSNTPLKAPVGSDEGGDPYQSMQQRISRASSLAGQVMNEAGPGGSFIGMGNLALRGLEWARRRSSMAPGKGANSGTDASQMAMTGEEGYPGTYPPHDLDAAAAAGEEGEAAGGLGGIMKMLGPIGAVAASALSVFGIIQKGGGMIQGMRNVASVRGGAAGEGAQVEFKARMMAMNPFITQDQARQIYQSVMSEGYADASGSGADNVIEFMKTNLTNMNMSVAESAKLLRSTIVGNVKGDPQSVSGAVNMLRTELDDIRTLSRQGVISQPDYRSDVSNIQQKLIDAGASPADAAKAAMVAEQTGSNDQVLKRQMGLGLGDAASSTRTAMALRVFGGAKVPGNLLPDVTMEYLTATGQANDAEAKTLKQLAQMAAAQENGTTVGHINAVSVFRGLVAKTFPSMDAGRSMPAAKALYEQLQGGGMANLTRQAQQDVSGQPTPSDSGGEPAPVNRASISTPTDRGVSASGGPVTSPNGVPLAGTGSSGGGGNTNVSGNVTIDLTPQAAQLFSVVGGNNAKLTPTQIGANKGLANFQVNAPPPGDG